MTHFPLAFSMTLKPETKNWIEIAKVDFEDSLYLYKSSRHPNSVYLMCQAIEKLLKAAQVELLDQRPRKIHDLQILLLNSGLGYSIEQEDFLKELTTHYERVRYRDLGQAHYNTQEKVKPIIKQSEQIYLWILSKLENH